MEKRRPERLEVDRSLFNRINARPKRFIALVLLAGIVVVVTVLLLRLIGWV
jgi:hypothetical protein